MMSLEQAIKHAEEKANTNQIYADYNRKYGETHFDKTAKECEQRAEEHKQLAAWLRELQARRKQPEIVRCGECKHYKIDHPKANGFHCCYRCHNIFPMKEDDFCSRAERRTE